MFIQKCNL